MSNSSDTRPPVDLFIIGGGINGCRIARDAAGRGLSVKLAEMNDLASATSSASTKLFHGGLRYLEYFELSLVRHALKEREVLLRAMPHIAWPMRFIAPYHADMRYEGERPASKVLGAVMPWMRGRRPAWLIRFGLFLYDHLGGRKFLPATGTLNLPDTPEGAPLDGRFKKAFEYSECWIEDSRLVVLNARDAGNHGARIMTRTKVLSATRNYVLKVDDAGAPLLNIFGGKITTYRVLAEDAIDAIAPHITALKPKWTAGAPLPGGDFSVDEVERLIATLQTDYPFLTLTWAKRLIRAYGTDARGILSNAKSTADLDQDFGATLTEAEVCHLVAHEYATCANDILWRRSKLGLRLDATQSAALETYLSEAL